MNGHSLAALNYINSMKSSVLQWSASDDTATPLRTPVLEQTPWKPRPPVYIEV